MTEHDTKTKLEQLRAWLAHHCIMMAIRCDFNVTMRRAHTLVCHAAARAAIDAGAEGDLRVRIIVDNGIDEYDMGLHNEQTEDGEQNNASPPPITIH